MLDINSIIDKYTPTVYGIALSHMPSEADDIYQQTFLALHEKSPDFESEEHLKAWLIRTTLNYCKKAYTKSKRTISLEEAELTAVSPFSSKEENGVLIAVRSLPEKYRTVIWLFYFEDMSTEEIAKSLKISGGAVRTRLSRGRDLLREILTKGDLHYDL